MKQYLKYLGIALGLLILFIIYYFLNQKFGLSIPCIFYEKTGYYCPGCGITRMFFSLLKLDIYQAFRYNPLVFSLIIIYFIKELINHIFKKQYSFSPKVTIVILIITILFGIARNTETFSFLAPTIIK